MDVPLNVANGRLSELVRQAENGEDVLLTRHGAPVARVVPVRRPSPPPPPEQPVRGDAPLKRLAFTRRAPLDLIRYGLSSHTLVAMLIVASCAWTFIELADEMMEGETRRFDMAILMALHEPGDISDPWGPGWVEELGRDFTALGGVGVLTVVTLAVAGLLWLQGNRRSMWFLLASVAGGLTVSTISKMGFDRPRPDLVPHESIVYTASFPSGHSMMAAVTYLTLAVLLARVQPRRAVKLYLFTLAVALTVAVGFTRIYLGVHWPTDVLAGWAAGAGWALLCWLAARWLQSRNAIEPERDAAR